MSAFCQLSIIIPIGPDDNSWQTLLKELEIFGSEVEIILSACQEPTAVSLPENASWLQSKPQRAKQLNYGAESATRAFIWFLHADTRLTEQVSKAVQSFIEANYQTLGYFQLQFADAGAKPMQLNSWGANLRSRYFGLPFGDQGFLISQARFRQLNGFDESLAIGEDLDFIVRLKHASIPLTALPARVITSARRYQQHGWLSTTRRFLWLTIILTWQAKHRLRRNE